MKRGASRDTIRSSSGPKQYFPAQTSLMSPPPGKGLLARLYDYPKGFNFHV